MPLVRLDPIAAVEGGGLIDDTNAEITSAVIKEYDYGGKAAASTIAIVLGLRDEEGNDHSVVYSIGRTDEWAPTKDGKKSAEEGVAVMGLKGQTAMRKSCNAYQLLLHLSMLDYPQMDELAEDISTLVGVNAHWKRIELEARKGLNRDNGRPPEVLIPDELLSAGAKSKGASAKKATADVSDDTMKEFIATTLAENDGSVTIAALGSELIREAKRLGVSFQVLIGYKEVDKLEELGFEVDEDAGTVAIA